MAQFNLAGKTYEMSTTLKVIYKMREYTKTNSLQEAIDSISKLDLDGQLKLLYYSYKCAENPEPKFTETEFTDAILDSMGVFAITNAVNDIVDGLLYSGLSEEELASKKMMVEEKLKLGAISSAEPIE